MTPDASDSVVIIEGTKKISVEEELRKVTCLLDERVHIILLHAG